MTDSLAKIDGSAERLSAQERQIVELFLKTLSPNEVATQLDLPVKAVLDVLKRADVRTAVGLGMLVNQKERVQQLKDGIALALWQMGTHDIKDMFDEKGKLLPIPKMPAQIRASIKSYKYGKYGPELQFVDKSSILMGLLNALNKAKFAGDKEDEEKTIVEFYEVEAEET